MSLDTAIELMESIKKYMVGEDGNLRIVDNDSADALAECAVRYLADEAQKDAELAKAFYEFLSYIDQIAPLPEDPYG